MHTGVATRIMRPLIIRVINHVIYSTIRRIYLARHIHIILFDPVHMNTWDYRSLESPPLPLLLPLSLGAPIGLSFFSGENTCCLRLVDNSFVP